MLRLILEPLIYDGSERVAGCYLFAALVRFPRFRWIYACDQLLLRSVAWVSSISQGDKRLLPQRELLLLAVEAVG